MNAKVISILTAVLLVSTSSVPGAEAGSLEGTWNELATTGGPPADRGWQSAIYEPVAHRMIIFAGWSGSIYNSLNDTWALDLATHTWSPLSTTGGPPATRVAHVGVYDSSRHRMVIYGGHNWWTSWRNDTWALDLTSYAWSKLPTTGGPPPARHSHGGFYDAARDRLIIFGGIAGGDTRLNDTWTLDLSTLAWSKPPTTGGPPSPRHCFASAYVVANDQIVISAGFGGPNGIWHRSDDSWVLDLGTYHWTRVADAPYGFGKVGTAFDDATGRMMMVGGHHGMPPDSMALVFDVWSNTWFDVNVAGATPPIRGNQVPSAIFDPVGQRTIMFGGGDWSLSDTFNDTWELLLSGGPGDLNCDGEVNFDDIDPFVLALSGQAAYSAVWPNCNWLNADCNRDGKVNFDDIDPFVELLSGD